MYDVIETHWGHDHRITIDTIGLDYESAVEATPRWYGVSMGNGNDGVSQMYPTMYVKTCEPYTLAAAAMLAEFKPGEGHAWVADNLQVDGGPDYTIAATLYDPPDDRDDYERDLEGAQEAVTDAENNLADLDENDLEARDITETALGVAEIALTTLEDNDPGSWSEVNGAWMILEVFQVDADTIFSFATRAPIYESLRECYPEDLLALAREI